MNSQTESSEEFNNFMHRVHDVGSIVSKLASADKDLQEMGTLEADHYLSERNNDDFTSADDVEVKTDRTVVNKAASNESLDPDTMSAEGFKSYVSRDADQRYKDKLVRTERMETLKKQATKAFRREEYEKALCLYDKAIDLIRDSPLLYNNRCVTKIKLKLYDDAVQDARTALKLNEKCLRSFLLLAKAYYHLGKKREFEDALDEAWEKNPREKHYIDDFIEDLFIKKDKNDVPQAPDN